MHTKPSKSNLIYLKSENLKFQKPTSFSGNHGHGRLFGISSLLSARFSALTLRALGRGSKCSAGPGGWTTWPGDCMEQLLGLVCYSGCCVWLVVATCTGKYGKWGNPEYGNSAIFLVIWLPVMVIVVRLLSYWWWFGCIWWLGWFIVG